MELFDPSAIVVGTFEDNRAGTDGFVKEMIFSSRHLFGMYDDIFKPKLRVSGPYQDVG